MRWLYFLFVAIGCAAAQHDNPPLDWGIVRAAADAWCVESAGKCCPANVPVRIISRAECVRRTAAPLCIGAYSYGERRIGIVGGLTPPMQLHVALHEYGHACGLGHDPDPAALMHYRGRGTEITPIDLDALDKVR